MKRSFLLILTAPLLVNTVLSQPPLKKAAEVKKTISKQVNIRSYIEYYEISTLKLADIMSQKDSKINDTSLRNKLFAMAKEGKDDTKLIDSHILSTLAKYEANTQSIIQHTYPNDWQHTELYTKTKKSKRALSLIPPLIVPVSFATSHLGSKLQIQTMEHTHKDLVKLKLNPEIITYLGETKSTTDPDSKAITQMPLIAYNALSTDLSIKNNRFHLVGAFTPTHEEKVVNTNKKLLIFIKPSVLKN